MSLTINQNLMAQNAARNLTQHYGGVWTIGANNVTPGNVNTAFITPDRGFF